MGCTHIRIASDTARKNIMLLERKKHSPGLLSPTSGSFTRTYMFKAVSWVLEMMLKFIRKLLCQDAHQSVKRFDFRIKCYDGEPWHTTIKIGCLAPSSSGPSLIWKKMKKKVQIFKVKAKDIISWYWDVLRNNLAGWWVGWELVFSHVSEVNDFCIHLLKSWDCFNKKLIFWSQSFGLLLNQFFKSRYTSNLRGQLKAGGQWRGKWCQRFRLTVYAKRNHCTSHRWSERPIPKSSNVVFAVISSAYIFLECLEWKICGNNGFEVFDLGYSHP